MESLPLMALRFYQQSTSNTRFCCLVWNKLFSFG